MSKLDAAIERAQIETAAHWRALHRERELNTAERAEFVAWLRESPAHVAAYLEIARVEPDLQAAARDWAGARRPLEADHHDDSVVSISSRVKQRSAAPQRRRWAPLSAAAAIAVIALGALWALNDGQRFGLPKSYATAHAEQGSWPLPDGSILHLNSDSRVVVRFSNRERLVTVQSGQAMFKVAKNHLRRFRVEAGDTQVIAVGTEFDVYRRAGATRVAVLEGTVAVVRGNEVADVPALAVPGATRVTAGEKIEVKPDHVALKPSPVDTRSVRAWTQRSIVLDATPLSEVVEDFNRYSSVRIEVYGDDVKKLRVSGVFGAYDVDSLLEFLRKLDGVRVEVTNTRIRILPAHEFEAHVPASAQQVSDASAPDGAHAMR